MSDVVNQLFSHLPLEKITSFSCGHIIPEENLQTLVVNKGPDGGDLEFKADKQKNPATVGIYFIFFRMYSECISITQIAQLGQVLLNFMSIVPAGMIVFFPSYKFLNTAKAMWLKTGTLDKFALKKPVCGKKCGMTHLYHLKPRSFLNLRRIQRLRKFFRNMRQRLPR